MYKNKRQLSFLILPAFLVILVFAIFPVVWVVINAFFETDFNSGESRFVGLYNFHTLSEDWFFTSSINTTIHFSIITSLLQVFLGLLLALLFFKKFPGRQIALPIIIYPMMISTLVASSIWRSWFHYDFGMLNHWLGFIGVEPIQWLFDPSLALYSIMLVDLWQWTPVTFLIILAGLQSIPKDVLDAAKSDGASYFQSLLFIILPMIKAHLFLALLIRSIDTFRLFDKVYALTGGGPGNATETLSMYVYKNGFKFFDIGIASAASLVMLFIACALSLIYAANILKGQQQK